MTESIPNWPRRCSNCSESAWEYIDLTSTEDPDVVFLTIEHEDDPTAKIDLFRCSGCSHVVMMAREEYE